MFFYDTNFAVEPTLQLLFALNRFPGVTCVAYDYLASGCNSTENHAITFEVEHTETGWHSLAFLAWLINVWLHNEGVQLLPIAPPPYATGTAGNMAFVVQCHNVHSPSELAYMIDKAFVENYEPRKTNASLSPHPTRPRDDEELNSRVAHRK